MSPLAKVKTAGEERGETFKVDEGKKASLLVPQKRRCENNDTNLSAATFKAICIDQQQQ